MEDYIMFVFYFANKLCATNNVVLLFHLDDLHVLKEVRPYLESIGLKIRTKWDMVDFLPLTISDDLSLKV